MVHGGDGAIFGVSLDSALHHPEMSVALSKRIENPVMNGKEMTQTCE